ncbi:hypothetical protein RN001_008685 [Aquatica leii]|uniref:Choline/carnitine acyltransferase domain-containing protein n=1 Tax=Aquatica leii TaxID=1421715 RepID=A0AAN7PAM2_9COLE|nr:hypothetical protein RN001_008685 [Aquatica leii]
MSGDTHRLIPDAIMLQALARVTFKAQRHSLFSKRLLRSSNEIVQKAYLSNENPQNLPQLPVPKLLETLNKYLTSVRPLLCDDDYCTTKELIDEFLCSDSACVLQNYLEQRAVCKLNWLEEWWLNTAYLGFRSPVVVYSSPGQSLPFQKFKTDDERLCYTAKLISAAASYRTLIVEKKIPVEKQGKFELDMNQYNKIFGTSRIPCAPIDGIQYYSDSEHIVIARRNHFFKMQLFIDCKPLSEKQIYEQLQYIMTQASIKDLPVGILSTDHRDNWARTYADLVADNPNSVAEIQQCLFLVCLDDAMPCCSYPNLQTEGALQFIHGGGSCANSGNRWFDKTIQFIVGCGGTVGLTYEHSPSEGQPVAVMVDYLVNHMKKDGSALVPDNCNAVPPIKLCFKINNMVKCHIDTSAANIDKLVSDFELICFKFEMYGKEFIKTQKLSPDSYIQMAMQLAFYRMHGYPGAHYESASTRIFVGGRTETIRSCSIESVTFAQCLSEKGVSDKNKISALKAAVDGHKQYATEAMQGCGVDRHLLGLKLAAKDLCCELPAFFSDVGYTRSTHFRLSTSQVATKCDALMAYGPSVYDGYGLCYNPRKNDINFGLSAWAGCCETNIEQFQTYLIQSLCDMQTLLCRNQKAKM